MLALLLFLPWSTACECEEQCALPRIHDQCEEFCGGDACCVNRGRNASCCQDDCFTGCRGKQAGRGGEVCFRPQVNIGICRRAYDDCVVVTSTPTPQPTPAPACNCGAICSSDQFIGLCGEACGDAHECCSLAGRADSCCYDDCITGCEARNNNKPDSVCLTINITVIAVCRSVGYQTCDLNLNSTSPTTSPAPAANATANTTANTTGPHAHNGTNRSNQPNLTESPTPSPSPLPDCTTICTKEFINQQSKTKSVGQVELMCYSNRDSCRAPPEDAPLGTTPQCPADHPNVCAMTVVVTDVEGFVKNLFEGTIYLESFEEIWLAIMAWTITTCSVVFLVGGVKLCTVLEGTLVWLFAPIGFALLGAFIGLVEGALITALIAGLYTSIPHQLGLDVSCGLGIGQAIIIVYFHLGRLQYAV